MRERASGTAPYAGSAGAVGQDAANITWRGCVSNFDMPAATDRQIDPLVYELCELTEEEMRIVEEATQLCREGSTQWP